MITEFVTTKDVRRITGLSSAGVLLHIKRGTLPATMLGHTYLIKLEDFRAWLARRAAGDFKPGWLGRKAKQS